MGEGICTGIQEATPVTPATGGSIMFRGDDEGEVLMYIEVSPGNPPTDPEEPDRRMSVTLCSMLTLDEAKALRAKLDEAIVFCEENKQP